MAPRPLESRDAFISRLRSAASSVKKTPLRFGGHHFSHVVTFENNRWQIRRLVLDHNKAQDYLAKHGVFQPEHAEMLAEPSPDALYEANTLDELIALLPQTPWPPV